MTKFEDIKKNAVVIAAGGCGSRFGNQNKLLAKIANIPVFIWSIKAFLESCENRIVLITPQQEKEKFQNALTEFLPELNLKFAPAGSTRAESVINGLRICSEFNPNLVAIHDAARPLITYETVSQAFAFADKYGSAVVSAKIADTIKQTKPDCAEIYKTLNRENLWAAQTPQIFLFEQILSAYDSLPDLKNTSFTDDSSVMEFCGYHTYIFPNDKPNIKITWQSDLQTAEAIMKNILI